MPLVSLKKPEYVPFIFYQDTVLSRFSINIFTTASIFCAYIAFNRVCKNAKSFEIICCAQMTLYPSSLKCRTSSIVSPFVRQITADKQLVPPLLSEFPGNKVHKPKQNK